MVAGAEKYLGVGLYSPAEAARLVRAPTQSVNRWLFGDSRTDGLLDPELSNSTERTVTFHDLMQLLAIRAARVKAEHRVSLQQIRAAIETAQKNYSVNKPLAYKHRMYEFDDCILIELEDRATVGLTGEYKHQHMIRMIIEDFLEDITYLGDGMAELWTPMRRGNYRVELNPRIRFGQPMVMPGNLLVEEIMSTVAGEKSPQGAARAHEIELDAVKLAIGFEDRFSEAN